MSENKLALIKSLDEAENFTQAIMEVHKMFDNIFEQENFSFANEILNEALALNLSLATSIAVLASTNPFKDKLSNRSAFYEQAEKMAIEKYGQERMDNSVLKKLK